MIACMHADKLVLAMVQIVAPHAQVEIQDADGIHFLDLAIRVAQVDVLRDGLGHAVEDTLQVIQLPRVLYLDDDDLALAVAGLDIHPVELVTLRELVALALQQFHDGDGLTQEHGEETFQHAEVGLLAQQALDGPVETDISVCQFTHSKSFVTSIANIRNFLQ